MNQPMSEPVGMHVRGRPVALHVRILDRIDFLLAALTGLLAMVVYVSTLAPGVLGGDSGEFQYTAWLGGFAHPTGYPLYLILGYLWTHLLPWHDAAWRLNLFSALCGALAVVLAYLLAVAVLHRTIRPGQAVIARRLLAVLAALTFAFTATFWSQAVVAEVYALNAVFVAAVLLGLVIWSEQAANGIAGRRRTLYWTAAVYGMGLAHHRTMILLVPAVALFLWSGRAADEPWRQRVANFSRVLPFLFMPLLLYLYIPLRAPQAPYAQVVIGPHQTLYLYQADLLGFLRYVTGQAFGGEISAPAAALDRLAPAAHLFVQELTWPGVVLGILGVFWLGRRCRSLLFLTGASFVSLAVFNLFYSIGDIYVYYIPLYLIWTVWTALGVCAVAALLRRLALRYVVGRPGQPVVGRSAVPAAKLPPGPGRTRSERPELARPVRAVLPVLALLAFALPAWLAASNYARVDQRGNNQLSVGWHTLLAGQIPERAILVSNDRDEMTPLLYFQYVEGIRGDLTGLFPLIGPLAEWGDVGQVIDNALASDRPVLLIKPMPGLEVKFQLEPAGSLVQVAGPAVAKPPAKSRPVSFADTVRLVGYDLHPDSLFDGATVMIDLYWQPLQVVNTDYTSFVHILNADGEMVAQDDHLVGGVYYPTHLWRPGELLKDSHTLALGADLGRAPYSIVTGLYHMAPDLQHLGRPEQIGLVGRQRPPDPLPQNLANPLNYTFDDQIALNGYEMVTEGTTLQLRFYWQALRTPDTDYTAFVHVLDATGRIVAQSDQQPGKGEAPTSTWTRGYTLTDNVEVGIPGSMPAGKYQVVAGLYDANTLTRLQIYDGKGRLIGDTLPLNELDWPPKS